MTVMQPRQVPAAEDGDEVHHHRVAVIGAGFSGLSVAFRLRERGEDFVVLERGASVGGVWRDNVYPGAACDVPSYLYSLSFAPNPGWERSYSRGEHIKDYLERVAEDRNLENHISLNEEVLDASWDEGAGAWRLQTTRRRLSADVLVACAGPLTEPVFPNVSGLDRFRGRTFHTARWDPAQDLRGQRVAVVGTGASAIQIVPELQKVAGRLMVFQRTPAWIAPRGDREISRAERRLLRAFPALVKARRLGQFLTLDLLVHPMIRRNRLLRRVFESQARSFLEQQVTDPELRAKLTPSYEIGCKRLLSSNEFYPALASPNVELVASAVREVREKSIVAEDGTEREVDAIVFATGFETTRAPILSRIRGRDGRSISEVWDGRPRFFKATTIAGFPNLFNLASAGTGSGHGSMVWKAESQTAYVVDALRVMDERGLSSVEARPGAQEDYMDWAKADLEKTVWTRGGCQSWYLDDERRPTGMWPGTMWGFRRMLRRFDAENYVVREVTRQDPYAANGSVRPYRPSPGRRAGTPDLRQRLESRVLKMLAALPPALQVRLSGRPPVRVDGQTLDPGLQLSLTLLERQEEPPLHTLSPSEARDAYRRASLTVGSPVTVGAVRDLYVEGADGPLDARHYAPDEPGGSRPLIVYYHGGGFVVGDLDTHDEICRLLCRHSGVHVLSVDYRLAPEHPFPAAVNDGLAAFRWAAENAAGLGADPARILVAGDSAGGNVAAVTAWQTARNGGATPAAQVLLYPSTDAAGGYRSKELFAKGFLLDRQLVDWFTERYAADADLSDPRVSILRAGDVSGLAPALVVTAGFDPLRDEGEAYARVLRAAGVPVVLRRFPGLVHGFCNATSTSRACREAVIEVAGTVRMLPGVYA